PDADAGGRHGRAQCRAPHRSSPHAHKEEFMTVEIRVPQLPESVADATLVAWRKSSGDSITRDENLADLETDKVTLEVPAPVNGVLRELKVAAGATVKSGDLLAVIEEGAAGKGAAGKSAASSAGAATAGRSAPPSASAGRAPAPAGASADDAAGGRAGPAARRVMEESHLARSAVSGSAPGGRITKADALQAAAAPASSSGAATTPTAA